MTAAKPHMSDLEIAARDFATLKHAEFGQIRKYTGEPYIVHPQAVANLVRTVEHDNEMLAAAWLHDVCEDCEVTFEEIKARFGGIVCMYVMGLTDISKPEDGNRAERKRIDRMHSDGTTANTKTIKLADLIDNSDSIFQHDPDFAVVYLREKKLLLPHLKEGNIHLWNMAQDICESQSINMYGENL